jgi:hypothetical protein
MRRCIIFVAVLAALAAPSAALASGVVLKVKPSAKLVAVATSRTHVALVHSAATGRLHVGQRVAVTGRRLGNGTLRASSVRVVGKAHQVRFRALLLSKSRTRYVVSAGGAIVTLHRSSRATSSVHGSGPQVGARIDITAPVSDDDDLDEDRITVVDPAALGGAVEGKLTIGTGTVTVSSEHLNLLLKVPAGLDLSAFRTGDEVLATFTQGADGSLTLTRLSTADDDEDEDEDHHDGDHHHGGHHGGGDDHGGSGRH